MTENIKMPLEGIKVVELATVVAAPTAGRMLSAYGAQVIKVESLAGDDYRVAGNFERVVCEDYKNPLFTIQNSGKKLVAINLKHPDGKAAMLKLLEDADVFLTNVRTGGLERLGLDYETLHERCSKLVYAHFSGFGPEGPVASNPGFDSTAFWLRSGPMADWQVPGSFPFNPTYAFGDMSTSSVLFSGILMALIGRSLGEKKPQQAMEYGFACQRIGLCISLCIFAIYFLGGRTLYGLFFEEAHIIEYGVQILRVLSLTVMAQISGVIFMGSLRGAGDVIYTTCASTISVTLVRTITGYFFCYQMGWGLIGLWLGIFSDQACRLIFSGLRFKSGSWTKLKI